jgi:sorbitol/mannitol transport system permease protein
MGSTTLLADNTRGAASYLSRSAWKTRLPLLPALLLVICVTQVPFFITVYYSTLRWNLVSTAKPRVVFLGNFLDAFHDAVFINAILNTAMMTVSIVIGSILIGGLLALGLQREFRGRGIARTLAVTSFFIMPVAAALFWKAGLFDPTFGLFGWITSLVGLGRISWISEFPRTSVVIVTTWQWSSFALMILLAGMQSFPTEVTEAAAVDGAGRLDTFVRLMLPHLRPFIELTALLTSMYVLENFAAISILTAGGPAYATTNLSYYVVQIVVPLIKPGLASTALLCGIFAWNEFFLAVNLTSTTSTLPVFLQKFLSFGELYTAQVAALATLINVPVVAAGWLAQKSLTRGLTFGAVK